MSQVIEILETPGSNTAVDRIVADETFAEMQYPGRWRLAEGQLPVPIAQRYISVGAFFDRFGTLKHAILSDTTPPVMAVIRDASVREYIDLDNPELPAGLQILVDAGYAVDVLKILTDPIQPKERPGVIA